MEFKIFRSILFPAAEDILKFLLKCRKTGESMIEYTPLLQVTVCPLRADD